MINKTEYKESVEEILEVFEKGGLVFKTWDIKKQDYVWHKTEFGHKVAKKMGIESDIYTVLFGIDQIKELR